MKELVHRAVQDQSSRWQALIVYRTEGEPLTVTYDLEELEELADIVEAGPDWNTILQITVTLREVLTPGLTIERDESLRWRPA